MALVTETQPRGPSPADRVSALLDSKPWLYAAVTIVVSLVIWDAGRTAFESDAGARPWLNLVVLAFVIYAAVVVLILVPRVYVSRAKPRGQARLSYLGWAFAFSPVLVALGLSAVGADQWAATIALVATCVLLLVNAGATVKRVGERS